MVRRFSANELPDVIPVFPLPGALLLPRGRLPLNIFEPRYLAMIEDCMKSEHRLIGMIQPREAPYRKPPTLHRTGCAGRLIAFSESDDGRVLVTLGGVSRYRILEEVEGFTPYRRVRADWTPFARDLAGAETDPDLDRGAFLGTLRRYFDLARLSSDWDTLKEAEDEMLVNSLAMLCPFEVEEKQALLEAESLADRRRTLTALMEFSIAAGGEEGSVQ